MKKFLKTTKYEKYYKDVLPYIKKDKNQQYFAIILTLGASIFFALFAINPTLSTIVKLRKEVNDSKAVERQLDQKVKNLSALSGAYQNVQKDLPDILEAIPQQPNAPALLAQIQSVAEDSETEITNIVVSPVDLTAPESTASSQVSFELTARSDYENINKFLISIIDIQRIVSVDSFTITNTGVENQSVELNLKGSAYFKQ